MTLTERTNNVLAKLRASDTPKDKALIVAIEGMIPQLNIPNINQTLESILKTLEDSL